MLFSIVLFGFTAASAESGHSQNLVLMGSARQHADSLLGVTSESFTFLLQSEKTEIPRQDLVRWSHPQTNLKRAEVELTGGSRIVLAESWGNSPAFRFEKGEASLLTKSCGRVRLPVRQIRAVMLNGPDDLLRRTQLWDDILHKTSRQDTVTLTNGDVLTGKLLSVNAPGENSRRIELTAEGSARPLSISTSLAMAASWQSEEVKSDAPAFSVGLHDGSHLIAHRIEQDGGRLSLQLTAGQRINVDPAQVASLQALGNRVLYLSDLEPKSFRHQPYLQLTRPLQRDRNVLGHPLRTKGNRYIKGLGMSTEAKVVYAVPTGYHRFAAELALDDTAKPLGSVGFRISLLRDNQWEEVVTIEKLTTADPPQAVSLELQDATQVRLETFYSDRADQRDYANWLDARFEQSD